MEKVKNLSLLLTAALITVCAYAQTDAGKSNQAHKGQPIPVKANPKLPPTPSKPALKPAPKPLQLSSGVSSQPAANPSAPTTK